MFFHFTRIKNLPSIRLEGLRTNSKQRGFVMLDVQERYHRVFGLQPIFLTDDPDWVIEVMLGKSVKEYVLLGVDASGLVIEEDLLMDGPCYGEHSFICRSDIGPSRLSEGVGRVKILEA